MTPFALLPTLACALAALGGGAAIGWPAAGLIEGNRGARLLIAPAIGLGLFGALGVLLFRLLSFDSLGIAAVAVVTAILPAVAARWQRAPLFTTGTGIPVAWLLAVAAIATVPALGIAPHADGDRIALGNALFDHGKIALVDEIARTGLPARNPFYRQAGDAGLVNYYYLFYLVAAATARITGAGGWAADVALTGIVGGAALLALGWGALVLGRRRAALWWVLAIACAATLRIPVALVLGPQAMQTHWARVHHFEGWLEQAFWVPQHVLGATLALLAILGLAGLLAAGRVTVPAALVVGGLIAAAYESSIWIGGFGLALVLPALGLLALFRAAPGTRGIIVANLALSAGTAGLLAADFIARNLALLGQRPTLGVWAYPVLVQRDDALAVANWLAYWLVLLAADFGFAYLVTLVWLAGLARRRRPLPCQAPDQVSDQAPGLVAAALALSALLPLVAAQHVRSIIANNDFGWRIVLPAAFAMTIAAAAAAARWSAGRRRTWILAAAALLLAPGVAAGLLTMMFYARPSLSVSAHTFDERRALWEAVRAVTPNDEAVLNNPADLATLTLWPANIGWALLADRRSCDAGDEWLASMAPQLLAAPRLRLDDLVARVFAGEGSDDDLRVLARDHLCATLVVVPDDGLWAMPPAADDPVYALAAEQAGHWRIYRRR